MDGSVDQFETAKRESAILSDFRSSFLLVAAIFVASVAAYWHGFGPGDSERYVRAALDWLENGFHLGETHWALRHPFVLPIAASFYAFGVSEFSATLPNIAYAAALTAITYYFSRRYLGKVEGTIATAFVATSAFLVARPLELEVYGAEIFYAALACWLFVAASSERRRYVLLMATGVAAGLAWAIREPTLYLMLVFGALTLWSRKDFWRSALALGVGFVLIIAIEWLFYAIAAGDPFYRYRIDLGHRTTGQEITISGDDATVLNTIIRPLKDLLSYPTTTPFLVIAIFWVWFLGWRTILEPPARRKAIIVFGAMSLAAVPICAYAFNLSFPRYYPILTYAIFLVLAMATVETGRRHGRLAAITMATGITFLNAAAADFSRYNEYAEARFLAEFAARSAEPIAADPLTASRARYQLMLRGFDARESSRRIVMTSSPILGALYFKSHVVRGRDSNWCPLEIVDVRPTNWTHFILRATGLDKIAGAKIRSVTAKPEPVAIVRVLERPSAIDPKTGRACISGAEI